MRFIGNVSGEGGPIVVMGAPDAYLWRGVDTDDYDRACEITEDEATPDGGMISFGDSHAVVWSMGGSGVLSIFEVSPNTGFCLVRSWPEDPADDTVDSRMASFEGNHPIVLGELIVRSSYIVVLWSPESGQSIGSVNLEEGTPETDLSIDGSGSIIGCQPGIFQMTSDSVICEFGDARRLHIRRLATI